MEMFVVAIDHALQLVMAPNDCAQVSVAKHQLKSLLEEQIPARNVRFIAEESDPAQTTIAQALAAAAKPSIPWKNIIMSEEERVAAGIRDALKSRPGHPDYETMTYWIESRIPEDVVREGFFIDETLQGAKGARSILVLLGDMHVEVVAERLRERGYRAETNHDLVPVRRWE